MNSTHASLGLGLALACSLALPAQRGIRQVTTSNTAHQNALLSPDGVTVAFRGPGRIGVVAFTGGAESTLVTGSALGDFLWSPTSSGLYFVDGAAIKFVARGGGSPITLLTVPGLQLRLWCVDALDDTLYGTRLDSTGSTHNIFTVDTSGGGSPTDIVSSPLTLDEVRLDPSGAFILYRSFFSAPFTTREYFRADANGANPESLTGGEIAGNPELASWLDGGQSIALTVASPGTLVSQVARIGPTGTQLTLLTDGVAARRNTVFAAGSGWIVLQAQYAGGAGPAVIPPDGGGLVFLDPDNKFYLYQGPPSVDTSGQRLVFAASISGSSAPPQIFAVELDRELRVSPRAVTGSSFQMRLPLKSNETGFLLAGVGAAAQPFPIGAFVYGLALDPILILVIASGGPTGGALTTSASVPADPSLVGLSLFLQGLRSLPNLTGDFTRYVEVRIF